MHCEFSLGFEREEALEESVKIDFGVSALFNGAFHMTFHHLIYFSVLTGNVASVIWKIKMAKLIYNLFMGTFNDQSMDTG